MNSEIAGTATVLERIPENRECPCGYLSGDLGAQAELVGETMESVEADQVPDDGGDGGPLIFVEIGTERGESRSDGVGQLWTGGLNAAQAFTGRPIQTDASQCFSQNSE